RLCPGAMFGLGAGENQPQLHNADYDFPDGLILYGVRLFAEIIEIVLKAS
ncbi:amidohydrolase, partial [filamentous cyanobacterium CCP5]